MDRRPNSIYFYGNTLEKKLSLSSGICVDNFVEMMLFTHISNFCRSLVLRLAFGWCLVLIVLVLDHCLSCTYPIGILQSL